MFATRAALQAFRPTVRRMSAAPKDSGSGFVSKIRKVPAELWPLGAVVAFAVVAAGYSVSRKLWVDSTMRLHRQNRAAELAHASHKSEEH